MPLAPILRPLWYCPPVQMPLCYHPSIEYQFTGGHIPETPTQRHFDAVFSGSVPLNTHRADVITGLTAANLTVQARGRVLS